jgi:hypothetical protein
VAGGFAPSLQPCLAALLRHLLPAERAALGGRGAVKSGPRECESEATGGPYEKTRRFSPPALPCRSTPGPRRGAKPAALRGKSGGVPLLALRELPKVERLLAPPSGAGASHARLPPQLRGGPSQKGRPPPLPATATTTNNKQQTTNNKQQTTNRQQTTNNKPQTATATATPAGDAILAGLTPEKKKRLHMPHHSMWRRCPAVNNNNSSNNNSNNTTTTAAAAAAAIITTTAGTTTTTAGDAILARLTPERTDC